MRKDNQTILSENTPVRVGLILAFLGIFGAAVYWGASINGKLDSIITFQTFATTSLTELKAENQSLVKEISDQKLRMALIEVDIKSIKEKLALPIK